MRRLLRDAMPLRRGEWGLAMFLYLLLTVMVGADWVGKLGADALFVKRYGIQNIPWMYIVTPIAMLAVSALIFFFIDRMRRRTMLLVYVAAVTLLSIGIQYAITSNAIGSVVQPISYIFAHGVKETIYILFWVYAGNLYDAEQSKRLFPFFAGSVLVGKIIGGVVGAGIAPIIHAENFIGAQAVGFFVCFVALLLYRGLPEGRSGHVEDKHRPQGLRATIRESTDGYRAVTSDPLLRTFGVGVFFWYFLMQFANFLYLLGLDQSSAQPATGVGREDVFSQLYASVYTSSSLVALAIQSFITSGLLRRIGIAWVLFFLPLWFLVTYAAAAVYRLDLVTGVALQLGERIWIPALHRPASELVYSQISAAIRPRARAFLSGGVNAFGNMAAAAALILGLQPYVRVGGLSNIETLLSAGTGVSLVFVYNAWHTRRLFGRRIARNLTSPDPDLRRNAADMLSSEGGAVPDDVLRALGGRVPADVEHGVRLALTRKGILAVASDVTE